MATSPSNPEMQALIDSILPPGFFDVDPRQIEDKPRRRSPQADRQTAGLRSKQKALLSGRDFVLPEHVGHAENGDLAVLVSNAMDGAQLDQIIRLAESGEQELPTLADLSYGEQQLQRRHYFDYLKRVPKQGLQRRIREEELEVWRHGGLRGEVNFQSWWDSKQRRRQTALQRKANRLANCATTGRRMDCREHPGEHRFYSEFKCQCRYCRLCGSEIFSQLFGKYIGLWCIVKTLLPRPGFRSAIVIAKLDFTAVNLGRMPTPIEIREFNRDIRSTMRQVLSARGVRPDQYGLLWCDEFGGWDQKKNSYNTNLHAHGVYVGPFIPQVELAGRWARIRAGKDGAKIVWISKQKIDNPPKDFLEAEHMRFVRAVGHALKYTGKHVSRSDGERLAQLEIAFHGVRRVHTMGLFYHADLHCSSQCDCCSSRCELTNGHEGGHQCKRHGHENRCPLCNGYLMFPPESGYAAVADLQKEGRRDLGAVRRQVARDQVFKGPRGPDVEM